MNNQKKSKGKSALASILARRQFRYGGYATVLIAVVIAVVILLNVALGVIENNWALTWDVSAMGITDFDDQTVRIVSEVDEPVYVYTMYKGNSSSAIRIHVEEVLNRYRAMNDNIIVENIDPVQEPARIREFEGAMSLPEGSIILTNADKTRVKLISSADYHYNYTSPYNNESYTLFELEPRMTSALMYIIGDDTPRVFYLTGHGELDATSFTTILTDQLEKQNYDVDVLNLGNTDVTLEAGDTLVVLSPSRDLSDKEYETLKNWLASGGRMLFILNYEMDSSVLVNFSKLLSYYQLSFGEGIVVENTSSTGNWNGDVYTLVPNLDKEHEITAPLVASNAYLMIPNARPINPVTMPESGLEFTSLLTTSAGASIFDGNTKGLPGTQTLGMSMIKRHETDSEKDIRIVLLSSVYVLADTNLINASWNMDFTLNVFNWLVNRQNVVSIGSKLMANNTLAISDMSTALTLGALVIVALPLIVLVAGVVVWIKRRRL